MSQKNVEIVRKVWQAYERGDIEEFLALCDPAVVWDKRHYVSGEFDPVYYGREGIGDLVFIVVFAERRVLAQLLDARREPVDAGVDLADDRRYEQEGEQDQSPRQRDVDGQDRETPGNPTATQEVDERPKRQREEYGQNDELHDRPNQVEQVQRQSRPGNGQGDSHDGER